MPKFDVSSDLVRSDTAVKARHRAHQSAYRADVLGLPSGPPLGQARHHYAALGNFLPEYHDGISAAEAGWNLMSAAARTYATARLDVIKAAGGMAESGRLWRNMLSSQPLAFSIVGEFRAHERAALSVLERLTRLDLVEFGHLDSGKPAAIDPWVLNGLQAEWAPPMRQHTGDRSGFDMAAVVRTKAGDRVLVTVEVKYVDSFSPQKLDIPKYASHLEEAGIAEADANDLVNLGASQFLRSLLLTNSVRQRGLRGDSHFDQALAVILCRADDQRAHKVVEAVGQACSAPGLTVGMWSHEQLLSKAAAEPALHEWAQSMQRRYVLGP